MILATIGNFLENVIIIAVTGSACLLIGYFAGRMGLFAKSVDKFKDE